jgi:hypothetical protein
MLRALAVALFAATACACAVRSGTNATQAPANRQSAQAAPVADRTPPSIFQSSPESACSVAGGTYLGDMKCRMPDGSIAQIQSGAVDANAESSEIAARPRSPQAWALATTAIMFEANGSRHDLLGGGVAFPQNAVWGRQLLSQWWGVNNRDQLIAMLGWLQFEGHRSDFEELGLRVDPMSEEQFKATEAALREDPDRLYSLQIVRQYHRALRQPGILGWDLVRYIALCRWGFLAGYLSQTEAWDHIMPAARRLQVTFTSWEALQKDYLVGREFWSLEQTKKSGDRYRAIVDRLLQDPNSPWNVNPWTTDLGVPMPLPVTAK